MVKLIVVIIMFINHMFKDDILYLEIDINYDFGNFSSKDNKFINEVKDYIKKTKIYLKNKKIILTCGGVIIGSILLTNLNNPSYEENIKYVPSFNDDITYIIENNNSIKEDSEKIIDNETEYASVDEETTASDKKIVKTNKSTQSQSSNTYSATQNQANSNNIDNNKSSNNVQTQPSGPTITIHRNSGSVITISLEEYVIGAVAAEMPASFNSEALKAQSVLARTYALKAKSSGKTLTDTVSTQSYIDINQMQAKWGSSYNAYYNKIKNAVTATSGEYLTYNGTYIEAMYHSTNNGKTESSLDVFGNYYPYLISVTSEHDKAASSYLRTISMDLNTISSKLGLNLTPDSIIEIISYTDGNNIKQININGSSFTGKQVRESLGLRSADFDISINGNNANITTRGFGHGVGMSQYGANGMANSGYSYQNILSHYYPGTVLKK